MTDATPRSGSAAPQAALALMASLALNVLIIGAVAGTLCFSRLGPGRHGGAKGHRRCSASRIRCRASAPI